MSEALAAVLLVGVGILLGLLGGGGSILTVPIFVYVLSLDVKRAIATSLLVVGITSAAALVPHAARRRVSFSTGGAFGVASMIGAFAGGRLARGFPPGVLLAVFAVTMLATGLAMLRGRSATTAPRAIAGSPRPWGRIAVTGLGIGLLTGTVGAGGGFLIVPALVLLCGLEIGAAVATSLLVIAMNSFAGFAGYLGSVAVDLRSALVLSLAAVAGAALGVRWSDRVRPEALRRTFAWFVLAAGAVMVALQA